MAPSSYATMQRARRVRNMRNKITRGFAVATIIVSCAVLANLPSSTSSAQQTTGTISISGVRARVTVRRDERGIPYIEAANDDDLYFAQGYITASDRLWQ